MRTNNNNNNDNDDDVGNLFGGGDKVDVRGEIRERCVRLVSEAMALHVPLNNVVSELMMAGDVNKLSMNKFNNDRIEAGRFSFQTIVAVVVVLGAAAAVVLIGANTPTQKFVPIIHSILSSSSRCLVDNNFLVREATRPPTNCNVCDGVTGAHVLSSPITRESFAEHAYSGRPVLAKGAALNWSATTTFSFHFFKRLYFMDDGRLVDGALESVEDDCQFFPFKTKFSTLADVFAMQPERANGSIGHEPWYIGWSNCDPRVAEILRKHYSRPHFLPTDSESSAIDWIFMGWSGQGASIHLDYVQRPSWQAQISGRKTWRLFPVPECENLCGSFKIIVEKGDIVFVDTNQWYHDTFIEPGEMSITIGSEYD